MIAALSLLLLCCACNFDAPDADANDNGGADSGEDNSDTGTPGSDENETEGGEGATEDDREYLELASGEDTEWCIVYPDEGESFIKDAAALLAKKIKSLCGITLKVAPVSESCDATKIIAVGNNGDEGVREIFKETKYYDFGVSFLEGKIVVSAYTKNNYIKAVEHIAGGLKWNENEGTLMLPKEDFMRSATDSYSISEWKINGTDISEYRIVYQSGMNAELVYALRDKIAQACGYYADVVCDAEVEAEEYEILIGNTNRAESTEKDAPMPLHYSAEVIRKKLVILSGGLYSLPRITEPVFDLITEGKNEIDMAEGYIATANLFDDTLDSSYAEGTDLRIMSCNILAELESWSGNPEYELPFLPVEIREELFFAALDYYKPTVIGLQELTTAWYNAIDNNYRDADRWELLKFENPNRADGEYVFSTVMYRSDLYELVDSGMRFYSKHNNGRARCYTWAVLRCIDSGKEFCFVSTHWDGTGREHGFLQAAELAAFVNEMQKKYPVFTTGDFNANENSAEFKQYLADCNITDAKYSALLQMNNVGSWHTFTKDDLSWGSCDHITSTADSTVLKFQTLYKNGLLFASDHCWLIADVALGDVKTDTN
jgi:endonuclease/exonuclease/phosphatase family metal-dependent hydrolase